MKESWEAYERILQNVYQQAAWPHIEYGGSTAWCSVPNTTLQSPDKMHNQELSIMTGVRRSSRDEVTERVQIPKIWSMETSFSSDSHPIKERFQNFAKG